MTDLPLYRYVRLKSAEHIRLLELLPRDHASSLLSCRLHSKTLSEASDSYIAISYAWGKWKSEDLRPINLDGCTAFITPNLHSALSRLQFESSGRLLWVDALCIDQSHNLESLKELAQQVPLMSRIYPSAKTVIIDLGDVDAEDEILMSLFAEVTKFNDEEWQKITAKFTYLRRAGEMWQTTSGHRPFNQTTNTAHSYSTSTPSRVLSTTWENSFRNQDFWIALSRFLSRPWFSRLWVVQEYALGENIQILLGSKLKPITFLSSILLRVITHSIHLVATDPILFRDWDKSVFMSNAAPANIERIVGTRHVLAQRGKFAFGYALHQTLLFKCTDIRDKVYGILGLVAVDEQVVVDYNQKTQAVALSASRRLISLGDSRYVLYHCIGCRASGPSWAIDLSDRKTNILATLITPKAEPYSIPYNACGPKTAKLRTTPTSLSLYARGYILDAIAEFTSALVDSTQAGNTYNARREWQIETCLWIEKHSTIRESFATEAFTTMITDMLITPRPTRGRENPRLLTYAINAYKEFLTIYRGRETTEPQQKQLISNAQVYLGSLVNAFNRRLAITSKYKLCCLIPEDSNMDDRICILLGCPIPFVIRRAGEDGWRIVGCCYVHGFMDGEVLTSKNWTEQYITIC